MCLKSTKGLLNDLVKLAEKKEVSWKLSYAKSRKVWVLDFKTDNLESDSLRDLLLNGKSYMEKMP